VKDTSNNLGKSEDVHAIKGLATFNGVQYTERKVLQRKHYWLDYG